MNHLADKYGLTERDWWVPAAVTLTSFAAGIQLYLLLQAVLGNPYPGEGRGWLAAISLLLLAAMLFLHVPLDIGARARDQAQALVAQVNERRNRESEAATPAQEQASGTPSAPPRSSESGDRELDQRLKVRVHTPLALGPVVAPGEPLPITINAEPGELAEALNVTIAVEQNGKQRSSSVAMTAPNVVHSETLEDEGAFTLIVTIRHPHAEPATKRIQGRVRSYREEIGHLFDELKADAENAGLDVAKHSTPREVARALVGARLLPREHGQGLVDNLQVALYDDTEVDRATYETVYAILDKVSFEAREVPH